ncbi:MAG: PLP-dependent aminotransferase family protein [Bacteroidetes bacterium]|nr:PLP-dependent aminotransferase family protein [Fibrella sp.]
MLPFKTLLPLDRQLSTSLAAQIANGLISCIRQGLLAPASALPGTRRLSTLLGVHRQTVVAAFDELAAQGWIEQRPSKGAFVSGQLPNVTPQPLTGPAIRRVADTTGYSFRKSQLLAQPVLRSGHIPGFDDGLPDVRLAPLDTLARTYRAVSRRGFQQHLLGYADTNGSLFLRQQLSGYLHDSRGVPASAAHIFTTRGSVMAIYLLAQILLEPGDVVAVGQTNYRTADLIFQDRRADLRRVAVDNHGLDVDNLAQLCRTQRVRLVYITSHHHYPTTVTLSADRRMRLLQLAEQHGFVILEDDYDYDFHYASSPILPLASADTHGMVVYVGSLSKSIAPAFRVGYVVAPPDLIEELGYRRRIIDRQGDTILEQAIAELFDEGDLYRHLKKAQWVYHQRRDSFCQLLRDRLGHVIDFDAPEGGMAVWAHFDDRIDLTDLATRCHRKGLYLNEGRFYSPTPGPFHHTRLGFASLTVAEMEQAVGQLVSCIG